MKVSGLGGVLAKINAHQDRYLAKVRNEVIATAYEVEAAAKTDVPVDEGTLRASIHAEIKAGGLRAAISAGFQQAPYAAFVEFGTGGEVEIPGGWEAVASEFRGKGVRKVNRKAQPFLIPNAEKGFYKLRERLKKL